jgi:hypothetical protein
MPDTISEGDHPRIISAKFGWDWLSSFRGEDFFLKIFLSEIICSIRTKFLRNSHWMVLFQKCVRRFGPPTKMAHTAELSLTWNPMGNSHKNLLFFHQSSVAIGPMVFEEKIFM